MPQRKQHRHIAQYGGGRGLFAPSDVSGLQVWLKADSLVLSNTDPVSSWTDSSGAGNNATQATGSLQPLYITNVVNGKPVVRFDGVDNFMAFPNFIGTPTAGSVFYVAKLDADPPAASGAIIDGFTSSGDETHWCFTDGTIYDNFGTSARKTVGNPTPSLATAFRIYTAISAASDWRAYLDGTSLHTTATNTVGWGTSPILGRNNAAAHVKADVAEVLFYNIAVSTAQQQSVQSYLGTKYGITVA